MKPLLAPALLAVLGFAVAGCGGSHAREARYSVARVEAAFAAHGLTLHRQAFPTLGVPALGGVIQLRGRGVWVLVGVAKERPPVYLVRRRGFGAKEVGKNVIVGFRRTDSTAVAAAVHDLQ